MEEITQTTYQLPSALELLIGDWHVFYPGDCWIILFLYQCSVVGVKHKCRIRTFWTGYSPRLYKHRSIQIKALPFINCPWPMNWSILKRIYTISMYNSHGCPQTLLSNVILCFLILFKLIPFDPKGTWSLSLFKS